MALDLDTYLKLPRVSGLALSPDGRRLVTTVAELAADGTEFVSALWEVDPEGTRPARRLTWSVPGEGNPAFLPDGGLLFTSKRPVPGVEADEPRPALWLMAAGGEGGPVASTPAGIDALRVARDSGTVVVASQVFPAATLEEDKEQAEARRKAKVKAVLFERYPVRFWDHELGPRETRLLVADQPTAGGAPVELRDVTPEPGRALDETTFDVTPDGGTVVAAWQEGDVLDRVSHLVAIDVASGRRRTLLGAEGGTFYQSPVCSPDGRLVATLRLDPGSPREAESVGLWLVELATGAARRLAEDLDVWPGEPVWAADSSAVYFTADQQGRRPVFRVDVGSGEVRRLTAAGAFHEVRPAPDGRTVYALRSGLDGPAQVVRLDADGVDQQPTPLPTPGHPLELPGRVEELTATAADGTPVHAWLVLPREASSQSPAPLVVLVHGGPLASWNDWSWRWNPHLLAERGYAALLPDPALSTGYGQDFVQRGWGEWGKAPFTDLMATVDAAVARPDVDADRTALMGGSFGGYMANWVAGHTDRFRCIMTHASLWALDQFHATTDDVAWLEYEFGDPWEDDTRWRENSPHLHLHSIRTPMLVIHGENDDRVPIGEALRLYTELRRQGVEAKFLLFPDENHWILKPNNTRVWYETVYAWLDHHVLGKDFVRPDLL